MGTEISPIGLIKILLKILGVLPPENRQIRKFFKIWRVIAIFLNILLPAGAFHIFFYDPGPKMDKLEALLYITATFHINGNLAIFHLKQKRVENLLNDIESLYQSLYAVESNQNDLNKWARRGKSQTYFFISTYSIYTAGISLAAFIHMTISNSFILPFGVTALFIPKEQRVLSWMYHIVAMVVTTMTMAFQLSFICLIGTTITGLMEVLRKRLYKRGMDVKREEHIFTYQLHSKIINLTSTFNDIYGFSLALMTGLSSIQCCVTTYPIARAGFSMQGAILFGATNVFPIAVCETGNSILSESNKIFLATYDNFWYHENLKDRKELNIMMSMAKSLSYLHYRTILKFTYETYLNILQMAYSYMAMLRTVDAAG